MNLEVYKLNFDQTCRICFKSYTNMFSLFKTEAPSMLNFCGFLKVHEDDDFPNKICERCHSMLVQSCELKQMCLSSKSYFESLANKKEIVAKTVSGPTSSNLDGEQVHTEEIPESELTTEKVFLRSCTECQMCFSSEELFHEHKCNTSINDDSSVVPGNESVSNNSLFQSENDLDPVCDSELEDKQNETYLCPQCNNQFEYKKDFLVHQSIHSGKELVCNVCNKLFRTMKMLRRHIKTHMIAKSHVCKICDKGFCEATALTKHTRRHHLQLPREKKYSCDQCGQRFTDQYYLNLHTRKHTGEKPFECELCNKCFYDPRSYKVHIDVHKGTKPYLCSDCGKSFAQSGHLSQHSLVHTKKKPHACKVCSRSYTQSTSLHRHQKLHKIFTCCICSRSYESEKDFQEHKENHNNGNNEIEFVDSENI